MSTGGPISLGSKATDPQPDSSLNLCTSFVHKVTKLISISASVNIISYIHVILWSSFLYRLSLGISPLPHLSSEHVA
jgi:hypothetical protein